MSQVLHRPDLDGIRAIAVLAVLAQHTEASYVHGGWMGVDVFFVLSGFLITRLLLLEYEGTRTIRLGAFYARRALRLYPALIAALVVGAIFYKSLGIGGHGTFPKYLEAAGATVLYLQDITSGLFHNYLGGYFSHTWSLAVEEQFYLLWPPVLVLLLRSRRDPLKWAALGAGLSVLALLLSMHRDDPEVTAAYYLPWCRMGQLLFGCCLAVLVCRGRVPHFVQRPMFGAAAVAACMALYLSASSEISRYPDFAWQEPAIGLATTALIWHLENTGSPFRRVLGTSVLVYLGRRSYGIYLIHFPVLVILVAHLSIRRAEIAALMLLLSVGLAALSYRFIEMPFLRIKKRLRPPTESALPTGA